MYAKYTELFAHYIELTTLRQPNYMTTYYTHALYIELTMNRHVQTATKIKKYYSNFVLTVMRACYKYLREINIPMTTEFRSCPPVSINIITNVIHTMVELLEEI